MSSSSHAVYDISKFNSITGSASMASPAPYLAYHLTDAKVKQSDLLMDYEPLPPVKIATYKGKAPAAANKRKHGDIDGSGDEEEQGEDEDDSDEDSD